MTIKIATVLVALAALAAPLAARAADSDSDRKHPMTFVKDSVITTKIKAKLAEEKMYSFGHVMVDTDRAGVVVLGGTARSQGDADKAVSIARATEGVKSVTSTITVKKDD